MLLIKLLDGLRVDICIKIRTVENGGFGSLFDPKILRGLEVVAED